MKYIIFVIALLIVIPYASNSVFSEARSSNSREVRKIKIIPVQNSFEPDAAANSNSNVSPVESIGAGSTDGGGGGGDDGGSTDGGGGGDDGGSVDDGSARLNNTIDSRVIRGADSERMR